MELGQEKVFDLAARALSDASIKGLDYAAIAQAHTLNWNAAAAQEAFICALELAPEIPEVLDAFANFNAQIGNYQIAIKYGERADALLSNNRFGLVLIMAGEYERAQQWYEKAAAETKNNGLFLYELSRLASRCGDYTRALDYLGSVESKINSQSRYLLAYGYKLAGSSADALRVIGDEDLASINQGRIIQAITYLSVGQNEQALRELELAVNNPTIAVMETAFIKTNAFSDRVLDQPAFVQVREYLGYGKL
jgi:tetratricopeptide (TPR) repeat protein